MFDPLFYILKKVKSKVESDHSMRNLWALLMLVVIASGMFALNPSVFAQQSSEQSVNDDMTVDGSASSNPTEDDAETTEDDATTDDSETTQDDTGSETTDESEENYAETDVDSPREQLVKGVDPHQIQCDTGLKMAFRANTFQPVCLKDATYQILSQRGWVSSVEPTQEELSSMLNTLHEDDATDDSTDDSAMEEDSTTDSGTEDDAATEDSDASTDDTSTAEPTPQSHQVNLSESMAMATN
ncbi:MAG: hypothetical protein EB161_01165 [Nitrosopumilaceae archaeon]|nr:hypothetical protein [Nitrosopumilaceae archaeon]